MTDVPALEQSPDQPANLEFKAGGRCLEAFPRIGKLLLQLRYAVAVRLYRLPLTLFIFGCFSFQGLLKNEHKEGVFSFCPGERLHPKIDLFHTPVRLHADAPVGCVQPVGCGGKEC